MPPKVSVIVPNYNHAPYLKERIDSILNQTYQDFELILLDDCSTDNSRDILLSYKDNPHVTQIVFNETNSGSPFAQWNKGIELAKGEWIWIAESDDWADLDFLEVMMREVAQYPSVGLAYAKARYMHEGKEIWPQKATGRIKEFNGIDFVHNVLLYDNLIYNVSMTLFERQLYYKISHPLYNQMRVSGDWMFYILMCQYTHVLQIDDFLSYYRMHSSNTSVVGYKNGLILIESLQVLHFVSSNMSIPYLKTIKHWGKKIAKARMNGLNLSNRIILRSCSFYMSFVIIMIAQFYYCYKTILKRS